MLQTPDARKERKERESKEKKEKNDENISIFLSSLFLSSSIFDFELSLDETIFLFFFFFLVSVIVLRRSTKEKRDEWRPMLLRAFVTRYAQKPRMILPRVHADLSICLIYPSIYLSGDFFSNLAARTLDVVYYCQF